MYGRCGGSGSSEGTTESGLLLIPMVVGLMGASTVSSALISRTGRYKIYPILGTVFVALAVGLMPTLTVHTSLIVLCGYVLLLVPASVCSCRTGVKRCNSAVSSSRRTSAAGLQANSTRAEAPALIGKELPR